MMDGNDGIKLFEEGMLIVLREISLKQQAVYQRVFNLTKSNEKVIIKLCSNCGTLMNDYETIFYTKGNEPIPGYQFKCCGVNDDSCEVSYCPNCIYENSIIKCECGAIHCQDCIKNKESLCNVCYEEELADDRDL